MNDTPGFEELAAAASWSPGAVADLETLVRTGTDLDLFRVNPLRYAADHGLDEAEAVDLFLHAARLGIFDIEWLIVCASCANVSTTFRRLENLDPHFTCSMCTMANDADLDDYIHVVFTVAPRVRDIAFHDPATLSVEDLHFRYHLSNDAAPLTYGVGITDVLRAWTRHQAYLNPGEAVEVSVEADDGVVRVIDLIHASSLTFAIQSGVPPLDAIGITIAGGTMASDEMVPFNFDLPATGPAAPEAGAVVSYQPRVRPIGPGMTTLRIHNTGSDRASVWLVQYPMMPTEAELITFRPVLTAKRLLSTQTFRRLFRSESVPDSETLRVRDLTFMFTDLKDSTALYDSIGDATAYNMVRLHFDVLTPIIDAHSGAVVKTIGDAVMATFIRPIDALEAAAGCLTALGEFNTPSGNHLVLKIGLHRGRAIVVNLNGQIDYFGGAVNVAARVQQLAGPGEIVLTGSVYGDSAVRRRLGDLEGTAQLVRGVDEPVPVYTVKASTEPSPPPNRRQ